MIASAKKHDFVKNGLAIATPSHPRGICERFLVGKMKRQVKFRVKIAENKMPE